MNRSGYNPVSSFPGEALAPLRPVRLQPFDDINAPLTSSAVSPTNVTDAIPPSGAADTTTVRGVGNDIDGIMPPSYDETTRGRPPTQITYFIRR